MAKSEGVTKLEVAITAPDLKVAEFEIEGESPLVLHRFGEKAKAEMRNTQVAGQTAKSKKKREPKDFALLYEQARHISRDGWDGIPAPAFRNAMIDACRMVGFKMTHAKMSVFILPDGFDRNEGTPLVRITRGEPSPFEAIVRFNMTTDLCVRPMWAPGWRATVRVRFDAEQFTIADVSNLLLRAGLQVGVGEGRPFSKSTCGQGWGTFRILDGETKS